ncbi:MAG: sigma-54-dependent transcriptional regulator [Bryobacteraceae bacterium]
MHQTRVLVVDDEENARTAFAGMIAHWGYTVETAVDGLDALGKLADFSAHVILADMMMPRMDGMELLRHLKAQGSAPPVIIVTAFGNIASAVATVRDLGAFWFLEKPVQPEEMRSLLERAVGQARLTEDVERLERQLSYKGVLGEMVGHSEPMQALFALLRQVAPSRAAVLLTGESGTGKELAARAIHGLSPRKSGPFVALNCAAIPETLMESELFGHEKGAFTGALERRAGCFELARDGTLLLDEIGAMPVATQAKLLRVLEDGRVRRLGGNSEFQLDVRVIAATNTPLENAIGEGKFREDLYYRLNVFHVHLPPLRERYADLSALCSALLIQLNQRHGTKVTGVSPELLERFRVCQWPGNVRELRNALERAVILAGEGTLGAEHLPPGYGSPSQARPLGKLFRDDRVTLCVGTSIEEAERALVEMTLDHTKKNKTRAAELLGVSLKTLFNKLKGYGDAVITESEAQPASAAKATAARFPRMFVLMPFDEALRPVFEDHIKPIAEVLGLTCGRADDLFNPGSIILDIWAAINQADVVVADCTGKNANVFYEIGIAHTLGKDTVLISQSLDDVPFDLRHLRIITYDYKPRGMSAFEERLKETILRVLSRRPESAAI